MNLKYSMTNREIAELTGKRHDHVLRDIEKIFEEVNAPNFGAADYLDNYVDNQGNGGRTFPQN